MRAKLKSQNFRFSHVAELYIKDNEASWTAKIKASMVGRLSITTPTLTSTKNLLES